MFDEFRSFFRELGPGLVTGASDDDPAGIATYAQAGARFGTGPLWLALLTIPCMIAIQEMCARIALVTRKGLIENIKSVFPRWFVWFIVGLLACANTFNIGADLGMMASSAQGVVPLTFWQWLILFGVITVYLQVFISYPTYARYLKWLTVSLLSYVLVALVVQVDWGDALRHTLLPSFQVTRDFLFLGVAFLGTTISPYLYVWQSNSEVEAARFKACRVERSKKGNRTMTELRASFIDVVSGMSLSNIVAWFIILTAASVLHAQGITDIDTADQAARMLAPIAGSFASFVFALGIIGTGLLGVPVLSSVIAYAVCELIGRKEGLASKWFQAKYFYGIILASTTGGILINALRIPPVHLLLYSAVANAVIAPPLLFAIIRLSTDQKRLKGYVGSRWIQVVGYLTLLVMTAASIMGIWFAWSS